MSTPTGEGLPAGAQEMTPLLAAMEQLDLSTQAYFATCTEYTRRPSSENEDTVQGTAAAQATAAEQFLEALVDDAPLDAYQKAATQFLLTTDGQRVDTLNGLLGSNTLKKMDASTEIPEHDTTYDEETLKHMVSSAIAGLFEHNLLADTDDFIRMVGNSGPALRLARKEALKAHAVDLGKMAVGGVIGVIIATLLARKRS